MGRLQRVYWRQNTRAVQEVPGLPILRILLLHLYVFAIFAADSLVTGFAGFLSLALTLRLRLLHAAQEPTG